MDNTLLKTHLDVVTEAVGALRFPINGRRLHPTINLVLFISFFSGFISQHILPYVTVLFEGTSLFFMNFIVSVPFISLMPCASYPSSLEKERFHIALSEPFMRYLYSCAVPIAG